jgi:DNA-binding transcriptional LysR family regulator
MLRDIVQTQVIAVLSMRRISFDLDVLRTFVTGMEIGSFAKAADRLGRSTSAVSAQLKKLEELVREPIFRKAGRGLALTEAGETLLEYARRLLELNDEAAAAVRGAELADGTRLGLQEEFGDRMLQEVLNEFALSHASVRVETRVARNPELLDRVATGRLDMALVWRDEPTPYREYIADVPMCWIAQAEPYKAWHTPKGAPLSIVASDSPCYFRTTGLAMLDQARIPWRHSFTSPNLSALWSAVSAGRGITIRTALGLPQGVRALASGEGGLPVLPSVPLKLAFSRAELSPPSAQMAVIVSDLVRESAAWVPGVSLHPRPSNDENSSAPKIEAGFPVCKLRPARAPLGKKTQKG